MNGKTCKTCNQFKPMDKFAIDRSMSDGHWSTCKECDKHRYKNPLNRARTIYRSQCQSAKHRNMPMPAYSIEEFTEWLLRQPKYHELHATWKASGYIRKLAPSVDRINDYKSYSFDNIQVMSWEENKTKFYEDERQGNNTKRMRPCVYNGVHYKSISEAARVTGLNRTTIRKYMK